MRTTIRTRTAAVLTVAALAAPAAAHADQYMHDAQYRPALAVTAVTSGPVDAPAGTTATAADDGFAWGDAGIGAAVTMAALGLASAGLAAGRRRHGTRAVTG
jgi:hypothetical protein